MKPPRKIRVGPHVFRIVLDKHGLMDGDCTGRCSLEHCTIGLDPRLSPSALRDTLLHELVHACLAALKLADDNTEAARLEENVCLMLGPGLLDLLNDNPDLVKFLTS